MCLSNFFRKMCLSDWQESTFRDIGGSHPAGRNYQHIFQKQVCQVTDRKGHFEKNSCRPVRQAHLASGKCPCQRIWQDDFSSNLERRICFVRWQAKHILPALKTCRKPIKFKMQVNSIFSSTIHQAYYNPSEVRTPSMKNFEKNSG